MNRSKTTTFRFYLSMLFLNSFVDLGHKITIQNVVFKVYDGTEQIILISIVNSLILLPFILLYSPIAYLSNRFDLVKIMRFSAWVAVACTMLIAWFYTQGNYQLAFIMTLVLAIQSAVYSPAKYGYIKQLMGEANLVVANARVQVATIIAILSGTLIFSILFEWLLTKNEVSANSYSQSGILQAISPLGGLLVLSSLVELMMAYRLPNIQSPQRHKIKFDWSTYFSGGSFKNNILPIIKQRELLMAVLGLSVFWGLSQMILAAFPAYAKQVLLQNNAAVIQTLLACSGLGILLGAILIESIFKTTKNKPLHERQLRRQMIPFGALGVSFSLVWVPFVESNLVIGACFFGVGFFGAYFIVPLNAMIQSMAPADKTGSVLAGNNWLQNISMLSFLGLTITSALGGFETVWLFYLIAIIAALATLLYIRVAIRDLLAFVIGGLFHWRYQLEIINDEIIPQKGAVLLLGNHVSWIDWVVLQMAVPRVIRYVIDRPFYTHWLLHWMLKRANTIPITPTRSKEAIKAIKQGLVNGDVVGLFPEGQISPDGCLHEFKAGFTLATANTNVKIVPFYIDGLLGSRFTRVSEPRSTIWQVLFRHKRLLRIVFDTPISHASAQQVEEKVKALRSVIG